MLKLIQNEFVKIFSKISTYIMLVILLLFIVGVSALMKVSSSYEVRDYVYTKEELLNELDYLKSSKPDGYELQAAKDEYMLNSGKEWNMNSWEYQALEEAWQKWQTLLIYQDQDMTQDERDICQKNFDDTIRTIEAGDWNAYANLRLEQIAAGTDSDAVKEADSYWYRYMLEHGLEAGDGDWREMAAREVSESGRDLAVMEQQKSEGLYVAEESYEEALNRKAISEYRLEHGIENYIDEKGRSESTYWMAVLESAMLVTIVSVIMIVLAGGCVANEFANGTIKFLLVNPVSRRKIIISKYLTMLILAVFLILGVYAAVLAVNIPFFGADFGVSYLTASEGSVTAQSGLLYGLTQYLLEGISLVAMTTMAFMISSMMRSSALAIGIGVTALMGGKRACGISGSAWLRLGKISYFC